MTRCAWWTLPKRNLEGLYYGAGCIWRIVQHWQQCWGNIEIPYELVRPRGSRCICQLFPDANLRFSSRNIVWSSLRVQPNDSRGIKKKIQRWAYMIVSRKIRKTFSPKSKGKNEKQNLTAFEAVDESDANHVRYKQNEKIRQFGLGNTVFVSPIVMSSLCIADVGRVIFLDRQRIRRWWGYRSFRHASRNVHTDNQRHPLCRFFGLSYRN